MYLPTGRIQRMISTVRCVTGTKVPKSFFGMIIAEELLELPVADFMRKPQIR